MYAIRNDVTGACWQASAAEARLYAIDGLFSQMGEVSYSVFHRAGAWAVCLHVCEIR